MKFKITSEQLEKAKLRNTFGELKNSIRKGEGNLIGSIGEIILMDYYTNKGSIIEDAQKYDYDFKLNGFKIEVKTQEIKLEPKDNWTCHVPDYNAKQNCDYYAFMGVNLQKNEAFCLGLIKKDYWSQVRKLKKQGEMGTKYPFKCDTWVCLIKDLKKI
jgi:hypothetical protein